LVLPEDGSIEFARTTPAPHHFSIYASAEAIYALASGEIIPVEER